MKIRFNKTNLIMGTIVFLMISFSIHCYFLVKIPDSLETIMYSPHLILFLSVGLMLWYLMYLTFFSRRGAKFRRMFSWLNRYLLVLCTCLMILVVYTCFKYPGQPIISTLRQGSSLFIMMTVPFICLYCVRSSPRQSLLKIINFSMFIWYLIMILESIYYSHTGGVLFNLDYYFNYGEYGTRTNGLRISMFNMGDVMILYNFAILYFKPKIKPHEKVFSVIQFILGVYCLVVIQQTRAATLYILICLFTLALLKNKGRKRAIINLLLVLGVLIFLLYSPTVNNFIQSFGLNGSSVNSTRARMYAFSYYWECFLKSPFVGNGLASSEAYSYVEHGSLGLANYNDVGFMGLLGNIGLMAIVIFIIPIVRMIKNAKLIYHNSDSKVDRMFSVAAVEYFIISAITLLGFTSPKGVLVFALIFAYLETQRRTLEMSII